MSEPWRNVEDEIASHIEFRTDELMRGGLPENEARAQARREFGNRTRAAERSREAWRWPVPDEIWGDVRYALRAFRLNPGFTAIAVGMLALGIGVNAAVFSIANAVLFKGFTGVKENQRLVYMTSFEGCCVSYPDFLDWRAQARLFAGMEITHGISAKLSEGEGAAERYDATEVSAGTFSLVGAAPALGRDFTAADEQLGARAVAILQYDFWQRRFLGDAAIIGREIRLNRVPTTIIGVMPRGFLFPQKNELWVPLVKTPAMMKRDNRQTWMVAGRLAPGVTLEQARAEMQAIGRRLEAEYPETNKGLLPIVENYTEFLYGRNSTLLYASLWGAVGFVLLIACANLANLQLARAVSRQREISLRMALGAGRWRLVRQLVIESMLLAGAGGMLGLGIARLALHAFLATAAQSGPWLSWISMDYSLDLQALLYAAAISVGTGVVFGLIPALRISKVDGRLTEGGRGFAGNVRSKRLSTSLVAVEMALAVVLLAGAGVMMRSFLKLYTADLGIPVDNMLSFNVEWRDGEQRTPVEESRFYQRLLARLAAIPGVASVSLASRLPAEDALRQQFEVEGQSAEGTRQTVARLLVTPRYFETIGARILAGRPLAETDREGAGPVVIVNERFAGQHWPGENPLGKRLRLLGRAPGSAPGAGPPEEWLTVVGVASNVRQGLNAQDFNPLLYVAYQQHPFPGMSVIARAQVPPDTLMTAFRGAVQELDPGMTLWRLETLESTLRRMYWKSQFYGTLFVGFAAIALFLAAVGLYGVTAYAVSQRTQEIGVRMALGGSAGHILRMVFREGMAPVWIGLGLGMAASVGANRVLESQLVQVSPNDPLTLAATTTILLLAAMIGCGIPARRAVQVDPAVALRRE